MKLIAYPLSGAMPAIRPATAARDWIDALPEQYGYRCLPLNIASQMGWEVLSPCRVTAVWDGGPGTGAIRIDADGGHHLAPASHFGHGVLTFHIGALLRTPPGIDLFVGGPINRPKDGIAPLAGVIETDWSPYPFTMNWMFTTAEMEVTWEEGEPFAQLFPIPRGLVEDLEPEVRQLDDDPELARQHRLWADARARFNEDLGDPDSIAAKERWQKGYYRGLMPDGADGIPDHRTKLRARPFPGPDRTG